MQIPVSLSKTLPLHVSLLLAARSALTTALLAHQKTFDMSRLTLLYYDMKLKGQVWQSELVAQTEISQGEATPAGQRYHASVEIGAARLDFELLDRKRGLKKTLLHHLQTPEQRISSPNSHEEVVPTTLEEGVWTLEQLLSAAQPDSQAANFRFYIYGVADSARSIQLLREGGLLEIIQENALIAQLI